jgi:hypothetical protein
MKMRPNIVEQYGRLQSMAQRCLSHHTNRSLCKLMEYTVRAWFSGPPVHRDYLLLIPTPQCGTKSVKGIAPTIPSTKLSFH